MWAILGGSVCINVLLLALLLGRAASDGERGQMLEDLRAAAIEHGCAAYDQTTGEWRWK